MLKFMIVVIAFITLGVLSFGVYRAVNLDRMESADFLLIAMALVVVGKLVDAFSE